MTHTMDEGSGWTQQTGVWTISSNTAVQATAAGAWYIATTDVGVSNYQAHTRIKKAAASGSGAGGVVIRFTDINNFFIANLDWAGGGINIIEVASGVQYTRASYTPWPKQFQAWVDIDVTCNGNIISVNVDGGYGVTFTSSANNTATLAGIGEYRDGSYGANSFDDFQVIALPAYPWTRQGTVLTAGTGDNDNVYEPSVIYEGNARVLSGNVFKMWYTSGWATPKINYAESIDGINWTKYSGNPVLSGINEACVLKVGSVYYLYGHDGPNHQINQYTSNDGLTWTLANAGVITRGAGGQWDDTEVANCFVMYEGASDWKIIYEAKDSGGGMNWKAGYATSTDGIAWTKSGSNPLVPGPANSSIIKVGSYYYAFFGVGGSTTGLPSWIKRLRSNNLTTWEYYPYLSEMCRVGAGEGENTYIGQVADANILIVGDVAYFYFSASADGENQSGNTHIVLATADSRAVDRY